MTGFLIQRSAVLLATLLAASLLVFLVMQVLPGDPARLILGIDASADAVAALRQSLGLDRPWPLRFVGWLADAVRGDLGLSLAYKLPVADLLAERMAVTGPLALLAMGITIILALSAGLYAAARHRRWGDVLIMGISQIGIALPNFWLAMLLILLVAVEWGWLPAGGFPGWSVGWGKALAALVLPALALALVQAAILARVTRSAMLEVLDEDYIRTARAKGLGRGEALWRHGLRNALIPVITVMGMQFSGLLAGTIVIENVFALPGLGKLVFQAVSNRDTALVQGAVLLLAVKVILLTYLIDLLYAAIDPRLKGGDR